VVLWHTRRGGCAVLVLMIEDNLAVNQLLAYLILTGVESKPKAHTLKCMSLFTLRTFAAGM
jgi:hypothetical protein